MTLAAHGTKRNCLSCGATFFDLQRNPIVCPKCQAVFTPIPLARRDVYERKSRAALANVASSDAVAEHDPEVEQDEEDSEATERNPDDVESDVEPDDDILPLE